MNMEQLQSEIKSIIGNLFPDSYIGTSVSTLGGDKRPSLAVSFAFGKDKTVWKNGIIHNDNCHTVFLIHCLADDSGELSNMELNGSIYGCRDAKTYKFDKIGWRDVKKGGDFLPVKKSITRYFENMVEYLKKEELS